MITIDAPTLETLIPPSLLIPHLLSSLPMSSSSVISPPRLSFPITNSTSNSNNPPPSNLLLVMPSWSTSSPPFIGVKLVTSFPSSSPSTHASYNLFSSISGQPLASIDGSSLTLLRTASISAVASLLLSPPNPGTLVLVGAGSLSEHIVAAHRVALPSISRFIVWNRSPERAENLVWRLRALEGNVPSGVTFECAENLDEVIGLGDVVVCATGSNSPIVKGELIKDGACLNLMGSFTKEMRECDDEAVRRGRVFVDVEAAVDEAGELVGAMGRGVIQRKDVVGTLVDLVGGKVVGRTREDEVTMFKSVGAAVFDLLAAQLAYETYLSKGIYSHF